jgi:dCTP deaminase
MLVTYEELMDSDWVIGHDPKQVNGASIDLRLHPTLHVEDPNGGRLVDLAMKQGPRTNAVDCTGGYNLAPHGWCLGATLEQMNLPDNVAAEVKLKSSVARGGLNHLLAGWVDPGFHGSLTLELVNSLSYSPQVLRAEMLIVQLVFWKGDSVPTHASYRAKGRYAGNTGVVPTKGV